ncbi:hypothetical protein Vadar_002577 [Vaccinium darrowii]|uniref:Uncharacterized protein n=1 Tax=Vaccinium darrowii TaxID=229202 RepID=A0ACB7XF08_9ERIC|nr:hypothetical protein Vadar_002577 [Vaccinium darrowii]
MPERILFYVAILVLGKGSGRRRTSNEIHCIIYRAEEELNSLVSSCLVNLYGKCGMLKSARLVFDAIFELNSVSLTTLLLWSVPEGRLHRGVEGFLAFSRGSSESERVSCCESLGVWAALENLDIGMQFHSLNVKCGVEMDQFVVTGLINLDAKCGELDLVHRAFWEVNDLQLSAWTTLMVGCVHKEREEKLLIFLWETTPLFDHKIGILLDTMVANAVVDFYTKSGLLKESWKTFEEMDAHDIVGLNSMVFGEALEIYGMMQKDGVKPNDITFVVLLSACGHVRLLEEGLQYFDSMTKIYSITPRMDYLACEVGLFERKGETKGAYDFIRRFPVEPNKVVWRCLMSGCKTNKDLGLGKYAAAKILSIDPDDTSVHIMKSNNFAGAKMWNKAAQIRSIMKERALKKDL